MSQAAMSIGPVGAVVVEPTGKKNRRKKAGAQQPSTQSGAQPTSGEQTAPAAKGKKGESQQQNDPAKKPKKEESISQHDATTSVECVLQQLSSIRLHHKPATAAAAAGASTTTTPMRGIHNQSNFCYVAAVLQGLVHLAPFTESLRSLQPLMTKEDTPVSYIIAAWCAQYCGWNAKQPSSSSSTTSQQQQQQRAVANTLAVAATPIPTPRLSTTQLSLNRSATAPSAKTQINGLLQEDAHEFLMELLNAMQLELNALMCRDDGDYSCGPGQGAAESSGTAAAPTEQHDKPQNNNKQAEQTSAADASGKKQKQNSKKTQQKQTNDGNNTGGKKGAWFLVGKANEKIRVQEYQDPTAMTSSSPQLSNGKTSKTTSPDGASAHESPSPCQWLSPIKALFGGSLNSYLYKGTTMASAKQKTNSVNVAPFLCLAVDIVSTTGKCTLEEALKSTLSKRDKIESVDGKALSHFTLLGAATMPPLLIVQLKRWVTTAEGDVVKLDNAVDVGDTLTIPSSLLDTIVNAPSSPSSSSQQGVKYALIAAVCHRGDTANKGHYVTYLPRNNVASAASSTTDDTAHFVVCNDAKISTAAKSALHKETSYILMFQRKGASGKS